MSEQTLGGNRLVSRRQWNIALWLAVPAILIAIGWVARSSQWFHRDVLTQMVQGEGAQQRGDSAGAGTKHPSHVDSQALSLSPEALRGLRMQLTEVKLQKFVQTITVPGIVVERPGRSVVEVATRVSGIVARIGCVPGDVVQPGQGLFEIRLIHEDLVQLQADFLRTMGELAVINLDLERLAKPLQTGAIPVRRVWEQEYEKRKHEVVSRAQRESLRLHGLSEKQIEDIVSEQKLLQQFEVTLPPDSPALPPRLPNSVFQVQEINVTWGQFVEAGDRLAVLTDHAELFIEGQAFAHDVGAIRRAAKERWPVSASMQAGNDQREQISGLVIHHLAGRIDRESRAFHFYVTLPNTAELRDEPADGQSFLGWTHRPGERLQLHVPVQQWPECIVLPAEAVVQEGLEYYVFISHGDHFDRRSVHVEYRDASSVVVANTGALSPGEQVVTSGAEQLLVGLRLKGSAGPAVGSDRR